MSLKEAMNISDLSIEDVQKAIALNEAMAIVLNFQFDVAAATVGGVKMMKAIDLKLKEQMYRAVLVGAQCHFSQSEVTLFPSTGLVNTEAHVYGRLAIWDDEPAVGTDGYYHDQQDTDLTDEIDFANEDSSKVLVSWPFHSSWANGATVNVPISQSRSVPDGKPVLVPPFPIHDNKVHVTGELIKSAAINADARIWGSMILWVKFERIDQTKFNDMVMSELSNR